MVWALQNAAPDDVARLIAIYQPADGGADGSGASDGEHLISAGQVDEVLEILERCGARRFTEEEARRYRDLALGEALSLPVPAERMAELRALVESMISA